MLIYSNWRGNRGHRTRALLLTGWTGRERASLRLPSTRLMGACSSPQSLAPCHRPSVPTTPGPGPALPCKLSPPHLKCGPRAGRGHGVLNVVSLSCWEILETVPCSVGDSTAQIPSHAHDWAWGPPLRSHLVFLHKRKQGAKDEGHGARSGSCVRRAHSAPGVHHCTSPLEPTDPHPDVRHKDHENISRVMGHQDTCLHTPVHILHP